MIDTAQNSDLKAITSDLMVDGKEIYRKKGNVLTRQSAEIATEMLRYGIERFDTKMLLTHYIYRTFYVKPSVPNQVTVDDILAEDLVDNITYQDIGGEDNNYWVDSYWRYGQGIINRKHRTRITLRRGSQSAWAKSGGYAEYSVTTDDDKPLLSLNSPTHRFINGSASATYNWLFGQYSLDADLAGFVRFYFNLVPSRYAATQLARAIMNSFNLNEIPFIFKFLGFTKDYEGRADTAVLYVERRYLLQASFLIRDIYELVIKMSERQPILNNGTSFFAKRVREGLSFAEDPENNDSFGLNRCRLIAGLLCRKDFKIDDDGKRYDAVAQWLGDNGYDLAEFYKNPDSQFQYGEYLTIINPPPQLGSPQPPVNQGQIVRQSIRAQLLLDQEISWLGKQHPRKYLIAATKIAFRLCKEAIWIETDGGLRCSWMTYVPQESGEKSTGYHYKMLYQSGPDYEQPIGVKEFLSLIYSRYHACEIFNVTATRTITKGLGLRENFPKPAWADADIRDAWRMTFDMDSRPSNDATRLQKEKEALADLIIDRVLNEGRPLGNGFPGDDLERARLFCPNVGHGLAGLGYFFLSIYDNQLKIPKIQQ